MTLCTLPLLSSFHEVGSVAKWLLYPSFVEIGCYADPLLAKLGANDPVDVRP